MRILSLFESVQISLDWPVWLALAGLLVMVMALSLMAMIGKPKYEDLLGKTLMRGNTLRSRLQVGFRTMAILPLLTVLPLLAVISSMNVREAQIPQLDRVAISIADSLPGKIESRIIGIDAVRAKTSPSFVVGLRICSDGGHSEGLDEETAMQACQALDDDGKLDYFRMNCSRLSLKPLSGVGDLEAGVILLSLKTIF